MPVALILTLLLLLTGLPKPAAAGGIVEIRVLSTRADLVSGSDALIEVSPSGLRVDVDGRDVTAAFAVRPNGRFQGLVTGLAMGTNIVTARRPDGPGARLALTNHPRGGPVLAGPQVLPWTCASGAVDAQCNRPTEYSYLYMRSGSLRPYDPANPPSDVTTTTTTEGVVVPYIVRLEKGVIDRSEYQIAVLYDPARPWNRWTPQPGWNRKLLVAHGAGCGAAYGQTPAPDVTAETRALGKGFAVMSTALNNSGRNCGVALQAESMIMTKEYLIEAYGDVRYTMGRGGSGGALAQQWVANAYPGFYDGLLVGQSFPDAWSTVQEIEDCALLVGYLSTPSRWGDGITWASSQHGPVLGHATSSICQSWISGGYPNLLDPQTGRSCGVPLSQRYHPQDRPDGVRCSLQDFTVAILGRRAGDGFANRPYDNVGVQYGLEALRDGRITPAQFLDLNAKVGSHDIDYRFQTGRVTADAGALAAAYRSGLVNTAAGLNQVAIIDMRGTNTVELHHHVRTRVMRERIDRAHGHHDNHVIWWGQSGSSGDSSFASAAFDLMDSWLARFEADTSGRPRAERLRDAKPPAARDRCTDGSGNDRPLNECRLPDGTPRMAAGGPLRDDIVKCALSPLDRAADYGPVPLTDAQWQKLGTLFPNGVCDFSKPGNGYTPTVPWMSYADGPGGRPLGPPPRSTPIGGVRHAPIADSLIDKGAPTSNFGDATLLRWKRNGSGTIQRVAYYKFQVADPASISTATLEISAKLTTSNPSGATYRFAVLGVDSDGWTETGLTWSNAPARVSADAVMVGAFTMAGPLDQIQRIAVDVTTYARAQANGVITLIILDPIGQNANVDSYSKERPDPAMRPALVIS